MVVIAPSEGVFNETTNSTVFLFFLISPDDATVNVCDSAGAGFTLAGYYDAFGNFVADTTCAQALTAGELKIFAFEAV